jgi:hypothetical protein
MRHVVHIAKREIAARWILLPAAIVVGALAMLVMHSIDHVRGDADGVMNGTWVATLVVSIIVGMSLLGDELTNGRLSFYFARPFTPRAILGGKLVAGLVLALLLQAAIVTLVALALPVLSWQGSALADGSVLDIVGERVLATAACTVLGMAASIAIGSKTRWFVVDAVGLALVGVVAAWAVPHLATQLQVAMLAIAVLALTIATARAFTSGRTDRTRAHVTLSTTLWPIMLPAMLLVAAFAN